MTLFDLTLTLLFSYIRSILICYLAHPLGSLLANFGLAALIGPVSVADKARSEDFDIWADLTLTSDHQRISF